MASLAHLICTILLKLQTFKSHSNISRLASSPHSRHPYLTELKAECYWVDSSGFL